MSLVLGLSRHEKGLCWSVVVDYETTLRWLVSLEGARVKPTKGLKRWMLWS